MKIFFLFVITFEIIRFQYNEKMPASHIDIRLFCWV